MVMAFFVSGTLLLLIAMDTGHRNECRAWHKEIEQGKAVHTLKWMDEQCEYLGIPL